MIARRALARCVVVLEDDRVDGGIGGFGARDGDVQQFARAGFAGADQVGEADCVMGQIVG